MDKARNRTIKMTDSQYEIIRQGAKDRKLPLAKYITTACREFGNHTNEIDPEIICRLQTIKSMLNITKDNWNIEMTAIFDNDVEELCALLKW